MNHSDMFNARGGDGSALDLPGSWWSSRHKVKRARRRTFYHQKICFRVPNGSVVELVLVITTRRKWEVKMQDKLGWTVIPFLKNWVIVLRLMA